MFLENDAVLQVVDAATFYSAAKFLDSSANYNQGIEGVWLALLEARCSQYTRLLNRLTTDAGSIFTSCRWKTLTQG